MKPIYKPAGRALEYSPDALACNIYTGCPHRCYYCFSPSLLHMDREKFHTCVAPRDGLLDALKRQLDVGRVDYYETVQKGEKPVKEKRTISLPGKLIHLCFTCDPYPIGHDTSITREVIKAIKDAGCHVQILTKGAEGERDFDLLDGNDWFGVTITGETNPLNTRWRKYEPVAASPHSRITSLLNAHMAGIKTWVSCEPVIHPQGIFGMIERESWVDLFRIGKLNYHPSDIDWAAFGRECERLCEEHGRGYYLKADLRAAMTRAEGSQH